MTEQRKSRRQRGFTLVELLVVIVILGGLMAIIAPRIFGSQEEADIGNTEIQVGRVEQKVIEWIQFRSKGRRPPSSLEQLTESDGDKEPILEEIPEDVWGNPLVIAEHRSGRANRFAVVSWGPDGEEGTEDDIRSDALKSDKDD